jgi:hypothetical protein
MGKGSSSDDFVRDCRVAHRVSECPVAHLVALRLQLLTTDTSEGVYSPTGELKVFQKHEISHVPGIYFMYGINTPLP